MLPLRVTPKRLGSVLTGQIFPTSARASFATKSTASSHPAIRGIGFTALGGTVGVAGYWWLGTGRDEVPRRHDEIPRLRTARTDHLEVEPSLSEADVTRLLSQESYTVTVKGIAGVNRYDGTQVASNAPCEDTFTHGQFPSPTDDGKSWLAWGVFDGHGGWQTAHLLPTELVPYVSQRLGQIQPGNQQGHVSVEVIQRAVKQGFLDLDESIFNAALNASQSDESLQEKVKKVALSSAGSCALLSLFDPATSTLHVACTGDSRAVLGQQGPDGKWKAIPLSVDQTGKSEEEGARLHKEHPGEEDMIKDGRLLGLMVTRAFGDGRWKWPLETQKDLEKRFHGTGPLPPRYKFQTPPYLTAEPVVTSTKIDPSKPSFLIMATDGLWDNISNEHAVDLVGKWIEIQAGGKGYDKTVRQYEPLDFGKFGEGVEEMFVEERTTIQDNNAAVHLARNSLGGNNHELLAGRLVFSPPFSRRARDDITVQVVFFNSEV